MPQTNKIRVEIVPKEARNDEDVITYEDVNYISLVNSETFGIPALITEDRIKAEGLPVRILYVNPENIAAMEAVREA